MLGIHVTAAEIGASLAGMSLPELDADLLEGFTHAVLKRARRDGAPDAPALVALPFGDPEMIDEKGFCIAHKSMRHCGDPLEFLCHIRREPTWCALGLFIDGWMKKGDDANDYRTLARDGGRLRDDPDARKGRLLQLVATSGAVALGFDNGEEIEVHSMADGSGPDGPIGPLLEGLRRVLGLPNPPCPIPVEHMWATEWLGRVHRRFRRRRTSRTGACQSWEEIAFLHPALALARDMMPTDEVSADFLVPSGRVLARARPWDELQLGCVTGDWPVEGVSSAVASWCDTPMFTRLVLRGTPPLWWLVPKLRRRLEPENLGRVEDALAAWGLDWDPPAAGAGGSPSAA